MMKSSHYVQVACLSLRLAHLLITKYLQKYQQSKQPEVYVVLCANEQIIPMEVKASI